MYKSMNALMYIFVWLEQRECVSDFSGHWNPLEILSLCRF